MKHMPTKSEFTSINVLSAKKAEFAARRAVSVLVEEGAERNGRNQLRTLLTAGYFCLYRSALATHAGMSDAWAGGQKDDAELRAALTEVLGAEAVEMSKAHWANDTWSSATGAATAFTAAGRPLITELRWNELAASMRVEVEKDIRLDVNSVTGGAPNNGQEKAKDPTANLFWVVDTIEATLQERARGPRFLFYVLIPAVLFGALSFVITTLGGLAYLACCALVMTASVKVGRNIIRSRQQRTYLDCRSSLLACLVTAKLTDEELVTRVAVRRRGRTLRALFLADSDAKGLIAAVSSS